VLDAIPASLTLDVASELDDLGYGSMWFGEAYGGESFTTAMLLASATSSLIIGTGIANIYARGPMATAGAARTTHAFSKGRFILGLGVSHQPLVESGRKMVYSPPITAMREYLDGIERATYLGANADLPPIVLAALGPKMLELSRDRTAGPSVHPYLMTPAHTHLAREILGEDSLLVVVQAVVLNQDREEALRRAHDNLSIYTELPNYRNHLLREGFSEQDLVPGGSDNLADALVAMGDESAVLKKVNDHLETGADHVCVQVLGSNLADVPLTEWRSLAAALPS
jgi:probable F420-dependent oxidoreductase